MTPPVPMKMLGLAGYSGSGKTTLIERLLPRFVATACASRCSSKAITMSRSTSRARTPGATARPAPMRCCWPRPAAGCWCTNCAARRTRPWPSISPACRPATWSWSKASATPRWPSWKCTGRRMASLAAPDDPHIIAVVSDTPPAARSATWISTTSGHLCLHSRHPGTEMSPQLLSVEAALAHLLDAAQSPTAGRERLAADSALGRVLAEPLVGRGQRAAAGQLGDGRLRRALAEAADGDWLPVSQRIPAGHLGQPLAPGSGGAHLHRRAAAGGRRLRGDAGRHRSRRRRRALPAPPSPGANIRRAGEDIRPARPCWPPAPVWDRRNWGWPPRSAPPN
jgi:hypothetical protein